MKSLILFISLLFSTLSGQNNFEYYSKAYNYVKNTRTSGELFTYYYDSSISVPYKICVSTKLYYIEKQTFMNEILDFEYKNLDEAYKKTILDSLATVEVKNISRNLDDYTNFPELIKLNENGDDCDLELLFGALDNQNRLRATLIPNKNKFDIYSGYEPQCGTEYLFYFQNGEIVKVFYKNFQK